MLFLTHDFVDRLCNDISSYPVPNPEEALNTFQTGKTISILEIYLGKQSERCEEIDDVIVCDSSCFKRLIAEMKMFFLIIF